MHDDYYAVIMAGGGGTRLWPLSRQTRPKQLLQLIDDRTFFQLAVDRLSPFFAPDHIFIVTVADQVGALREQVDVIPEENYLIEPQPRGTASVVGYAAEILQHLQPDPTMVVLTSDHIIENEPLFLQLLEQAYQVAAQDQLVTLGIQPTFPSTGYGYIHQGEKLEDYPFDAFQVRSFVEKPDYSRAEEYLRSNEYYWNSGMFVWKTKTILQEFNRQMPVLYESLDLLGQRYGHRGFQELLRETWQKIAPQTIDYGIMEHAQKVVVLPAKNLGWSDVGSWDSLFEILKADENGNVDLSTISVLLENKNCLIKTEDPKKIIVIAGLEDTIVIDTPDALLVCKKGESQKVRQIVNELKQKELERYL